LPAVDADTIEGLHGWYDSDGNKVEFPTNADKTFLDNHDFLWDKSFLQNYLNSFETIYMFGLSGNIFEMIELFDKVFFLQVPKNILTERLQHPSRANPMGNTEYQREMIVAYADILEKKATELKIPFIKGDLSTEEIFKEITSQL